MRSPVRTWSSAPNSRQSRFPPGERLSSFITFASHHSPPIIRPNGHRLALYLLLAAGLLLWTINLLFARPLFIDEANVARNLFDRDFAGLFVPLDHDQYAPPLYLVVTKLCGELLGYGEIPLRLPAFLGGLLAVGGIWASGRRLLSGYWALLPLALLFVNPTVLRYVGEVKPYGLDLGVAAILLALHLRPRRQKLWAWAVGGALIPWISLPGVFVLAAIGLWRLRQDIRWMLPIGGWLLSFGVLYYFVLGASVGSGYLNDFHADYFLPIPTDWNEVEQLGRILRRLLRLGFGFTVVALIWGATLMLYGALKLPTKQLWLLLPLGVAMAVSVFRVYSLIDRLMLFALPGLWLFAALSARGLYHAVRALRLPLLILTALTLGGTNIYRQFYAPGTYGDGRRLAEIALRYDDPVLHPDAVPVVDYYTRIHLRTKHLADESQITNESVRVYDVTTRRSTRQAIRRDSSGAAERGCEVVQEELFRAVVLRIRCPARNYDR
ncbi:hypothetical protein [Lewinella sp. JB7]|uniref:hypothetical protein n=1 Tax=Lewinella sp. JB7 TaxID=2962887 RepID=UPI0020C9B8B6|nr:hypothetical protein [Lewinella sp. JB7]MCP9235443.1 hypothetical protein [Lewinella sp. JB7]